MHFECVGIQFTLGDGAPSGPEMRQNDETGDAAQTEFGIAKAAKIIGRGGRNNLVAQRFVGFGEGAKNGMIVVEEETVDFRNGGGGGGDGMNGLAGTNGSNEYDTARAKEIGCGSEMPVNAVVAIVGQWNGNGIAIKLSLGMMNGGVGERRG